MQPAWAMPGVSVGEKGKLPPSRDPEDVLINKIFSASNRRLHHSASTLRSGGALSSQLSTGSIVRPPPSAVLDGLPCYPSGSPERRRAKALQGSWRAGQPRGVLRIEVSMAYGLAAADLNGTSDPYVVVRCGKLRRKTRVIMRQLAPVWNETLHFVGALDDFLDSGMWFQVYDWDEVGSADVLGEVHVRLEEELRLQTSVEVAEYTERLSPEGHLCFKVAWLPETDVRVDAHAASRGMLINHPADATTPAANPADPAASAAEVVSVREVPAPVPHLRPSSAAPGVGKYGLVPREKPIMIPVLLPHKFDYVQLTYERFAQQQQLADAERQRLERMRAPMRAPDGTPIRILAPSRSTPALVRPPSSDLFIPNAFHHGATVKTRLDASTKGYIKTDADAASPTGRSKDLLAETKRKSALNLKREEKSG